MRLLPVIKHLLIHATAVVGQERTGTTIIVREAPQNSADNGGTNSVEDRLSKIETLLVTLVERQQLQDWYDIDEFARLVDKAPFTVREWARLGRIHANKRRSGRGAHPAWVVSHTELERYRREGLLPTLKAHRNR